MSIRELPENIVNQIAAGEVIENPAAIIKELVENSIDAGSTNIEIDIENSGKDKIIIKDNGCGISKEDLLLAPKRHATSKITSFEDLYNIKTMGFRGEALASIFSISKAKIMSKTNDCEIGYEVSNDGVIKESGISEGTTINIQEIFYNTPARKKYLKSDNMELKAILDIVRRFEVIHYNIKITLRHNGKILVNKPAFKTAEDNIYYVFGKELKDKLFTIDKKINGIQITGFVGKTTEISYPYKKNQFIFVNNRFVKSKLINDAIYGGIGSNLMDSRHPFYVLFLEIDPELVDVNIHPTKIEIKFENETQIYEEVKETINELFETQESFKDFEKFEKDLELHSKIELENKSPIAESVKEKTYFSTDYQKSFEIENSEISYKESTIENEELEIELDTKGPLYDTLKEYKILGQLNKTYIIIQTPDSMYLLDQHVAEEKYLYEIFKRNFDNNKKLKNQKLLKPYTIRLNPSEMLMYKENKNVLNCIGFETEEFGENDIIVRAVPINIKNNVTEPLKAKDYLYEILVNKKIKCVEEENYEKLASMACRSATMAGDELSLFRMKNIVENLRRLKQPFNCPHGRPAFLKYPFKELDKKFKRIV